MEMSGQLHAPAALPPGQTDPGTHFIVGWIDPRVDLNVLQKGKISCSCLEFNPDSSVVILIMIYYYYYYYYNYYYYYYYYCS
jgi:hypothetical protein